MHKQLQVQQLVNNVVRHPPGGKYSYYYPGALSGVKSDIQAVVDFRLLPDT